MEQDAALEAVFMPVQPPSTFEETVERLGTAIRLGLLAPGSRLPPERELARRLRISRSTLRQPLRALIAAGLRGIDNELPLEPAFGGDAYKSGKPRVPHNIYDARDAFAASEVAADAFGADVVEHYLNRAKVEIDAFEAAVTDWERFRGFERL